MLRSGDPPATTSETRRHDLRVVIGFGALAVMRWNLFSSSSLPICSPAFSPEIRGPSLPRAK